jgi:SulP family sulfate permease
MSTPLLSSQRGLSRWLPILSWAGRYQRSDLLSDLLAGLVVAIMLVPQGMAYALLAGLPPQVGLYASIVPLILYGLLGTSRSLAVGPVALTSLLVAASISPLADQGSPYYLVLALTLALMVGLIQLMMGLARLGSLVNFISHPVLSGFTSAAALIIGFSQLKTIMGLPMPNQDHLHEILTYAAAHLAETNWVTASIGLGGIAVLLYFKTGLASQLARWGVPAAWRVPIAKSGPLVVVLAGILLVSWLNLDTRAGVQVVGVIQSGLPGFSLPAFDLPALRSLLPAALTISLVAFLESISVAKSLAAKNLARNRREKVDANQELVALGVANLGAAFTGGYPVTGGFSRSSVNFAVGASTGLASIITAAFVALTLLLFTPFFTHLPKALLGSIIVVAVLNLIDIRTLKTVWRYNKADAFSLVVTFASVLIFSIETGILVGVIATLGLYLWRTSRPHMAEVGRVEESEHFRNVLRHPVQTCEHVLALRIDENLYFANTQVLETYLLNALADKPQVRHLVLICSAINFIDASALETLRIILTELNEAGIGFHLAEVKGPVMDRLQRIGFIDQIGVANVYLSTHQAMLALKCC